MQMNFTAIDFETAQNYPASACSVGLVKLQDGKVAETYYSLIRPPQLYIRPDFTAIHGLTVDDVREAPFFDEIWESAILPFIGGLPLAAHYAVFDMGVLRAMLAEYQLPVPSLNYFCTCKMARIAWPGLQSYALTALAKKFGIVYTAHNALDDAMTCAKLAQMAAEKFDVETLEELLKIVKQEPGIL